MSREEPQEQSPPLTDLALRIVTMPSDANPDGDIFGGWIVSQMDLAGATVANRISKKRTVTVSIDQLSFLRPVFIGDEVTFYAKLIKVGVTSIKVKVEAWVQRPTIGVSHRVTEGTFTFVALDENRRPTPVKNRS